MVNLPILSLALWFPIIGGFLILLFGLFSKKIPVIGFKLVALCVAFSSLVLSFIPLVYFERSVYDMQFVEKMVWITDFDINYFLGVDGISIFFLPLTSLVTLIVIISAWEVIQKNVSLYLGNFLIMSGLLIGVFCALDGILFYVFFEATLIPMYFIIGIWGGQNRIYAAVKFFLYTLLGSLLALVALIYLYLLTKSFSILDWHKFALDLPVQIYLFVALFLAFAVKIPMWPVHTWLPDAHVEAPTGGSIVLAAIMLKLGGYGFLRLSLPILPDASVFLSPFIIVLSLVAISYIALVALVQEDMKKLIAYSSIAHMGFVTLGTFLFSSLGLQGAIFQMISHGFISGAMFFSIGVLYDRMHSRKIADYGGVCSTMPVFSAFFIFFALANCGLPSTSGFVGEFFVILAAVKENFVMGLFASLTLIFGAGYSLFLVKKVFYGEITNKDVVNLADVNTREVTLLIIFSLFILLLGVKPDLITDLTEASVSNLVNHVGRGKAY